VKSGLWALASARLVSQLGSWLLVVAVPAHVFALTGSVSASGLTLAAQFLPPAVLGPVAGILADRWDRRLVMNAANIARAVAVAVLLLVRSPDDVWLVYAALLAESVGTVVFQPAAQAHTPAVVGTGAALTSANALNVAIDGVVRLVGGPLGGFLYAWVGFAVVVWLDVVSYLVAAVLVMHTVRSVGSRRSMTFGFLRAAASVRVLLLVNTLFLAANASLSAVLVPFGMTVLGGTEQTGLLMAALGVGFLLGAPLLRALVDRVPPRVLLGAALATAAAGYASLFSAPALSWAWPAAVLIGLAGSTALSGANTLVQRSTPNAVLGRVGAVLVTGEAVATLIGALVGPPVAERLSISGVAWLAAGVTLLSAALAVRLLPPVFTGRHAGVRLP
jgi:MFS family permease